MAGEVNNPSQGPENPRSPEQEQRERINELLEQAELVTTIIDATLDIGGYSTIAEFNDAVGSMAGPIRRDLQNELLKFGLATKMGQEWKDYQTKLSQLTADHNALLQKADARFGTVASPTSAPAPAENAAAQPPAPPENNTPPVLLTDFIADLTNLEQRMQDTAFDPREEYKDRKSYIGYIQDEYEPVKRLIQNQLNSSDQKTYQEGMNNQKTYANRAEAALKAASDRITAFENAADQAWQAQIVTEPWVADINQLRSQYQSGALDVNGMTDAQAAALSADVNAKRAAFNTEFQNRRFTGPKEQFLKGMYDSLNQLVTDLEARSRAVAERGSLADQIHAFSASIDVIEQSELKIDRENNQVEKEYGELRKKIEAIRPQIRPELQQEFKDLEIKLTKSEYKKRRKAAFVTLNHLEAVNAGAPTLSDYDSNVFGSRIFAPMKNLCLDLARLGDAEAADFDRDRLEVLDEYTNRKLIQFSWLEVQGNIHGKKERTVPTGLNREDFPLDGPMIYYGINKGLRNEHFGDVTNTLLVANKNETLDDMNNWENPANGKRMTFDETAMGYIFRKLDKVYSGQVLSYTTQEHDARGNVVTVRKESRMKTGDKISPYNINTSQEDLIKFIFEEEEARAHSLGEHPRFDEHLVARAFRLHMMATLNHSYLAEGSAQTTDEIYYMFNWYDYCIKYAEQGTNKFSALLTFLLFGYRGINPLDLLYKEGSGRIVQALKNNHFWYDDPHMALEQKMASFRWLADPPLIGLQNVAHGPAYNEKGVIQTDPNTGRALPNYKEEIITPPLRYFLLREDNGDVKRYPSGSPNDVGEPMTFEDIQTQSGERLYEKMPFDKIGTQVIDYYNHLGRNGIEFLHQILKADEDKFISSMENPTFVSGLKNQDKYSMTLLPKVGVMLRMKTIRHNKVDGNGVPDPHYDVKMDDEVMNKLIMMLVYATCLIKTDTNKEKFWSIKQVEEYLHSLSVQHAITFEAGKAILVAVRAGAQFRIRSMDFLRRMRDQVKERAKFT